MFTAKVNGKLFNNFWKGHNIVADASLVKFEDNKIKCGVVNPGGFMVFNGVMDAAIDGDNDCIALDTGKLESIGNEDVVLEYDGNVLTAVMGRSRFKIAKYACNVIKEPPVVKVNPQCIVEFKAAEVLGAVDKIAKFKSTSITICNKSNTVTVGDVAGDVVTEMDSACEKEFTSQVLASYFIDVIRYLAKFCTTIVLRTDTNMPLFISGGNVEYIIAPQVQE